MDAAIYVARFNRRRIEAMLADPRHTFGADSFPPRPGTVSGDFVTISRLLNSPTLIERRLRSITEQRFISDQLLTGRAEPSGGAIQFEQSESIFPNGEVESIEPGAEFPLTTTGHGPTQVEAVKKWGLDGLVTRESVRRMRRSPLDRELTKISNGIVKKVDGQNLAKIAAAPIQTLAGSDWTAATADTILRQVAEAVALIEDLNEGFVATDLVLDGTRYIDLIAKESIRKAVESAEPDIAYTGNMGRILNLNILRTNNLPAGISVLVLDRTQLGGLADEEPLYGTSWWVQEIESWRLRGGRVTTGFVNEPNAAVKITGV